MIERPEGSSYPSGQRPIEHTRKSDGALLYTIGIDDSRRFVCTSALGFWSAEETDAYLRQLAEQVQTARARFGRAKVLGDLTKAAVQADAVASRFKDAHDRLYGPDGCLALVVSSQLVKGQWQRRVAGANVQIFTDLAEAGAWLSAA